MTFAERRRLELDYKEWLKRESIVNGVAIQDCALTVIGYLDSKGLINKMPKWIPVSSGKLPENNEEVWITDVEGKVERAQFYKEPYPEDGEKDMFACRTYLVYAENVLAWQSILKPEPYKEGE